MTVETDRADVAHWAAHAQEWIDWVRSPDHDAFWAYKAAFERFVGSGSGKAVEICSGEGRISRCLSGLGYDVTAVEPVQALLEAAQKAQSASAYVQAKATDIPLTSHDFDLVVLYNVLMDVDDLDGAIAEAKRLMSDRGRMVISLVHPLADAMLTMEKAGDSNRRHSYFDTQFVSGQTVHRRDQSMTFRSWVRPLSTYADVLKTAGLAITALHEPKPAPDAPWPDREEWTSKPLFLWMDVAACSARQSSGAPTGL